VLLHAIPRVIDRIA